LFSIKTAKGSKNTAGITISSDGISLAIVEKKDKTHQKLIHTEFYPAKQAEQASLLSRITKQHRLDTIPCNLVIAPEEYQLLRVETPEVPKQEISAAIRWRIKDLIDFHIDDAIIDMIDIPNQQSSGTHITQVVACRHAVIQQYVDLLHEVKCQLESIDVPELATNYLLPKITDTKSSIVVLNLWPAYARMSIYNNNDFYLTRASSIGSDSLSQVAIEDISSQSVLDSLALELQRTFDYFESYSRQASVETLIILSHGQAVNINIIPLLEDRLGLTVQAIPSNDTTVEENKFLTQSTSSHCYLAIGGALKLKVEN